MTIVKNCRECTGRPEVTLVNVRSGKEFFWKEEFEFRIQCLACGNETAKTWKAIKQDAYIPVDASEMQAAIQEWNEPFVPGMP